MSTAFIFPGQGSQAVGMGQALAEAFPVARAVFQEVDDALSQNLSKLMAEGPEGGLTLTENAQPALMAVSMAAMAVLCDEGGFTLADKARFVAGHSLGEYSALAAAGTFSLGDAARLLRARGRAMQEAVPVGEGAMAAILGLELEQVRDIATKAAGSDVCAAANDNAPGQVVVSGTRAAVERAIDLAKEAGAKRALLLPVSAPFHCSLMAPAAEVMAGELAAVTMTDPSVALVANVTAEAVSGAGDIRDLLVKQVTGAVRWRESVLYMKENGVERLIEVGAGKVLSGLARRIDKGLSASAVGQPADVEEILKSL